MTRVSNEDLDFAAEWIAAYEPAPDEHGAAERCERLIAWLDAQAARRRRTAAVRWVAKKNGMTTTRVRQAMAAAAAENAKRP